MGATGLIQVTSAGPRADIRLTRGGVLNAVNFEMFEGLSAAVDQVAASDARVCVVTGEGRSFCSGIDVADLGSRSGSPRDLINAAQAGYRKLATLPIPTIAAVQGHALGAGLQLAIACDLRVVTKDARMGLLELNYGLIPDLGGSTGLPRLVGTGRAKRMIWTGEQVTGIEAADIGLADVVVESSELDDAVSDLASRLAEAPPVAVAGTKTLIDSAGELGVIAGFDAEAEAQIRCMTDPGFADALAAGIRKLMSPGS